jgi:SAM-dependent methyltransferase
MEQWYEAHPNVHAPDRGSADRLAKSIAMVRELSPKLLIDIGCGTGIAATRIQGETGAKIICFDISANAVAHCRDRGLDAYVLNIEQDTLPVPDASIDVVFMAEVIEHLIDPDRALSEVRRALAPGGHVVLSTPNMACLINRVMLPLGLQPFHTEVSTKAVIGRRFAFLGEGAPPVGHLRVATYPALRRLLELNGFTVERVQGATVLAHPAFRAVESVFNRVPSLASILVVLAAKA